MKTETKTEIIYVSDDGKRRSSSKQDIVDYETRQCLEIFERRTRVAVISASSTLYYFQKGDIETFRNFHTGVDTDLDSENEGYYVYVGDSTYDYIGDDYNLYTLEDYQRMVRQQINHYQGILDDITDNIMMGETLRK